MAHLSFRVTYMFFYIKKYSEARWAQRSGCFCSSIQIVPVSIVCQCSHKSVLGSLVRACWTQKFWVLIRKSVFTYFGYLYICVLKYLGFSHVRVFPHISVCGNSCFHIQLFSHTTVFTYNQIWHNLFVLLSFLTYLQIWDHWWGRRSRGAGTWG